MHQHNPMLRRDFIFRKISLIQDDLVKLGTFAHFTLNEIVSDFVKQAAVERLLERIITRAIDVNQHLIAELPKKEISPPKDYRETFLILSELNVYPKEFGESVAKSVGTRNVLVHEYVNIDQRLVYGSIGDCLKDYSTYVDFVLKFLDTQK